MAIPQGTVNFQMALGKPGEQAFDMPLVSAQTRFIHSGADTNYFGYAYTETTYTATQGSGVAPKSAQVGGTGVFAGILVQPNAASSTGVAGNPLGTNYKLYNEEAATQRIMPKIKAEVYNGMDSFLKDKAKEIGVADEDIRVPNWSIVPGESSIQMSGWTPSFARCCFLNSPEVKKTSVRPE